MIRENSRGSSGEALAVRHLTPSIFAMVRTYPTPLIIVET
jgi:hypothetical protein